MKPNNLKILCIEDDEDTCNLVSFVFEQAGYQVQSCSQIDCLKLIHEQKFAAIILDNYFVEVSGISICQQIRSFDKATPIIFFSGEVRQSEIDKAMSAGANDYLTKPLDFDKLLPQTVRFIEQSQN